MSLTWVTNGVATILVPIEIQLLKFAESYKHSTHMQHDLKQTISLSFQQTHLLIVIILFLMGSQLAVLLPSPTPLQITCKT